MSKRTDALIHAPGSLDVRGLLTSGPLTDAEILHAVRAAAGAHAEAEAAVVAAVAMPQDTAKQSADRRAAIASAAKLRARADTAWRRLRKACCAETAVAPTRRGEE
jgi:hypothetical protein